MILTYSKDFKDLNAGFYKDLDTNFEQAFEMSEKNFSKDELLEMLKSGNIPQKQLASLLLENVENEDEAKILISNLTGCDGKIREAVALKINQILTKDETARSFFASFAETFADAAIDINANICRLVVDSVVFLKSDDEFSSKYVKKIVDFALEALDTLDKFIFRDKKYVINKQIFKLYWCLETLKDFTQKVQVADLERIIERSAAQKEYTIREKVAEILVLHNIKPEITEKLKNDENYYVRQVFVRKG